MSTWLTRLLERSHQADRSRERWDAALSRLTATCIRMVEQRDRARRERAEVRAVLAPLLDEPTEVVAVGSGWYTRCRFCRMVGRESHTADCLVNRRDALLGRS